MIACEATVLSSINELLGMLNPHPDGEGLADDANALGRQHGVGVPGAVAAGQHHRPGRDTLAAV